MDTVVKDGGFVPGPGGLPAVAVGLEETLNYVRLSLAVGQGEVPYDRGMGSRLHLLDREEEHAPERALAMANEALLWLPGVRVTEAFISGGGMSFRVSAPAGEGSVELGEL